MVNRYIRRTIASIIAVTFLIGGSTVGGSTSAFASTFAASSMQTPSPSPSPAIPNPLLPSTPPTSTPPVASCGTGVQALFCNLPSPAKIVGGIAGAVTNPGAAITAVGTSVAADAFSSTIDSIKTHLANATVWMADQTLGALNEVTAPNLKASWFVTHYRMMIPISCVVLVLIIFAAIIGSVLKGDGKGIARAFVGGGSGVIAMFAVIGILDIAVKFVDWMTNSIIAGSGDSARQFFTQTGASALAAASFSPAGPSVPILFGLAAIFLVFIAMIFVGINLLIRQAAIYVGAIFFPLSLTGLAWRPSSKWFKRLAWLMGAIVMSKFVIAAIASLAIAALPAPDTGVWGLFRSGGILMVAAFSPAILVKALAAGFEVVGGAAVLGHVRHPLGGFRDSTAGVTRHFQHAKKWVSGGGGGVSKGGSKSGTRVGAAKSGATKGGTATAGKVATGAVTGGVVTAATTAAGATKKLITTPQKIATKIAGATGGPAGTGNIMPSAAIPKTREQVHQQILNQLQNTKQPIQQPNQQSKPKDKP